MVSQFVTLGQNSWHPVQIMQVELREQHNSQGDKVFTVQGILENDSQIEHLIPNITIVLRQTDGHVVHKWYHRSSLASLKAGAKVRFMSSVQHDNPLVAYAEADFVK